MKYTIVFEEQSKIDFQCSFLYYSNISPSLADRFYEDIKNLTDEIERTPLHFQVRYRSIRIAHLSSFPYSIHFFIERTTIYVLRILHQKKYYD